MAAKVSQTQFLEVTGLTNGVDQQIGDRGVFGSFTPTNGEVQMFSAVVADAGTQVLFWLANEGAMATFEHCVIVADKDITIEFSDSSESYTISLKAGMFYSGGGQMFVDMAASSVDTMGDIDQIMIKRNVADGVGDAFVQMMLVG